MNGRQLFKFRQLWRTLPYLRNTKSLTTSAPRAIKNYDEEHLKWKHKPRNQYTRFYSPSTDAPKGWSVFFLLFLSIGMTLNFMGVPKRTIEWFNKIAVERGEKARKQKRLGQSSGTAAAANDSVQSLTDSDSEKEAEDESDDIAPKKRRNGFRDRRIIGYEDRIRSYSTPDKIFRYFSTLKVSYGEGETEIFMTPLDFVRSITPGVKQPDSLGLDSFKKYDPVKDKLNLQIPKDSVFYHFGENAIISFSDYVFLLTVISTPQKQFEIAFRMFDINGDGDLDAEEFDVVRSVILGTTAIGKRHRDHATTGMTLKAIDSALLKFLFGPDKKGKLTIARFTDFQQKLQKEIMRLEFERYQPVNDRISEIDFADALLIYAGISEQKKKKMIRRVKHKFQGENSVGISFEDYTAFSQLLRSITDVDTALTFYTLAGAPIDQMTLKHVTQAVANITLSDHLVDVVFTLFDENNDGQLSNKEFVSVMKQRLLRGLDKPMDTGFIRLMNALFSCAKEQANFQKSDY